MNSFLSIKYSIGINNEKYMNKILHLMSKKLRTKKTLGYYREEDSLIFSDTGTSVTIP